MKHRVLSQSIHGHLTLIDCTHSCNAVVKPPAKHHGYSRSQRVATLGIKLLMVEAGYVGRVTDSKKTKFKRRVTKHVVHPGMMLAYTIYAHLRYRR